MERAKKNIADEMLGRKIKAELCLQGKDSDYLAAKLGISKTKLYGLYRETRWMRIGEFLDTCRELRLNPMEIFAKYVVFEKWEGENEGKF